MIDFLIFKLIYIFILISFLGYGTLLSKVIDIPDYFNNFGSYGILGIIFFGILATSIHFFIPLLKEVNLLIIFIGFLLAIFLKKKLFNNKKEIYLVLVFFLVSLIMFLDHDPNEDFGYYHLPYIVNFTQEKIIFGLSNLQINQGWNSIWLNIKSFFYLPFFGYKLTFIVDAIFFIFVSYFLVFQAFLNDKNNIFLKYFSFFFLSFFILKFSRLNSYGLDVPANYFFIIFIYSLIYFFFSDQRDKRYSYLNLLILFSIFATSLRIINILCFIPIFLYLLYFKLNLIKLFKNRVFAISVFFGIFWTLQQFIYTSCLLIPSEFLCFETPWFDPKIIDNFKADTGLVNKSFQTYTGDLSRSEYLKNFNWVFNWFNRNHIELFEHIFTFLAPIIIYLILNIYNISKKGNFYNIKLSLAFLIIYLALFFLVWFTQAPVIRFGTHYIQMILFVIFFYFCLKYINFKNNIATSIIIIAIIFNVTKNIKRIIKLNDISAIYPKIQKVDVKQYNISGTIVNVPIKNIKITKSEYCWATAPLCKINHKDGIDIKKKFGYIILYKN